MTIVKMAHVVHVFHKFPGDRRYLRWSSKCLSNVAPKMRRSSRTFECGPSLPTAVDVCWQPSMFVHGPSTFVHRPSTFVHRPSTFVHGPSTFVHGPSMFVHEPSTFVHRPSTFVGKPSTFVHEPSMFLHEPSFVNSNVCLRTFDVHHPSIEPSTFVV